MQIFTQIYIQMEELGRKLLPVLNIVSSITFHEFLRIHLWISPEFVCKVKKRNYSFKKTERNSWLSRLLNTIEEPRIFALALLVKFVNSTKILTRDNSKLIFSRRVIKLPTKKQWDAASKKRRYDNGTNDGGWKGVEEGRGKGRR